MQQNQIKSIINQPAFNQVNALKSHYDNLQQKRAHLDKIIATVEKTIANKNTARILERNMAIQS